MRDPYFYPDSEILKNKFDLKDQKALDTVEADYTSFRIKQLVNNPLNGNFDLTHLCDIHKYIFQDIYEWAGEPRIINIEKSEMVLQGLSIEYSEFFEINRDCNSVFSKMKSVKWDKLSLQDKTNLFSDLTAELWRAHPFREGNTRTVITFMCDYADVNGFSLDRSLFEKNSAYVRSSLVAASAVFKDLGDKSKPEYLRKIVLDGIQRGQQQKKTDINSVMENAKQRAAEQNNCKKDYKSKNKTEEID